MIDVGAFNQIVHECLRDKVRAARQEAEPAKQRREENDDDDCRGEPLSGVAVDGKSLLGAIQADGRCIHLFSAMTHDEGVVIAQRNVEQSR